MTTTHQDFDLCLEKRAPHEFVAYVPDGNGGRAAEHPFGLRTDTLKMREDLQRLKDHSLRKELVKDDLHVHFGQMLYQAALGGTMGDLFVARLKEVQRADMGLRLRVRVDEGAPELMNLPWEFLHDGEGFLMTRWETAISRLPLGIARRDKGSLERILRMLVVVSSPLDLPEHQALNAEREQEIVLAALDRLQNKGLLDIDFCEDAVLDTIQDYLSEQEYDILHLTGHGVFNETQGQGELLLEDEQGNMQPLTNAEFAALLRGYPSLRLVVLSACQSARTANNDGYAGLSRILVWQEVPAVLAMQYSMLDEAAILFTSRFYTGLANKKPLDVALTEARLALRLSHRPEPVERSGQALHMAEGEEGSERMDFGTPMLFLNDPACVRVAHVQPEPEMVRLDRPVDWSTVSVMEKGFVGRRRELHRIRHGFTSRQQRAFVLHGLGGIGKSVLATRAATKLHQNFAGVKAVRMTATTRPEDILSELNAFLNLAGLNAFNQVIHAPVQLKAKTSVMAQILTQKPLLLVFDNFEEVLSRGREMREGQVSPSPQPLSLGEREATVDKIADPALADFFEQLVEGVVQGSRFIFTSRYDFDPARGLLTGEIEHIPLDELPFPMAVQCMNNHKVLASLPVIPPQEVSLAAGENADADVSTHPQMPPLTKRELYRKLGGHPHTIDVFAQRAAMTSVSDVWLEIEDVERGMIGGTLLDRTYAQLPPRAQILLLRASILEEAPPLEALQWMWLMGLDDEEEAMPAFDADLEALLSWGMLARQETGRSEVVYPMHVLVRDYARRQLAEEPAEDEAVLLLRAARFWELQAPQTRDLWGLLRARDYYYRAGDYQKANFIVQAAYDYLVRWGHIELTIKLLKESIETLEGTSKAVAIANLAYLYDDMDDYENALETYFRVMAILQEEGDQRNVAAVLQNIGVIYQKQGDYAEAQARYEQSLAIEVELGDKGGIATYLHQLGVIHQQQGNLGEAQTRYEQALGIFKELGDQIGIAYSLGSLGNLHYLQGDYQAALERYEECLRISRELGDKSSVAGALHQLGMIHQLQGKLGEAQARYEQSLDIKAELGEKREIATTLHQLGRIHQKQGSYHEALEKYVQALMLLEQLESPDARIAQSDLAGLREEMGEEAFAAALAELGVEADKPASGYSG
jgi:tetratricopeptide (TPR) repeat protein